MFVWDDVVEDGDDAGMAVATHPTFDGAQAGSHEGQPIFRDENVGAFFRYFAAHRAPVEEVDGVDAAVDDETFGCRFVAVLRLAGEEEGGVLEGEGVDFDLVAALKEFVCKPLVEGAEASTIGICGSYYDDLHVVKGSS